MGVSGGDKLASRLFLYSLQSLQQPALFLFAYKNILVKWKFQVHY